MRRATLTACTALGCIALTALVARRVVVLVNVIGASMEPTLHHGDRILVRRHEPRPLRRGDIAVLAAPAAAQAEWQCRDWHVKRVAALPGDLMADDIPMPDGMPEPKGAGMRRVPDGTIVMLSDNPAGRDSRTWGPYPEDGLLGTLLWSGRYQP